MAYELPPGSIQPRRARKGPEQVLVGGPPGPTLDARDLDGIDAAASEGTGAVRHHGPSLAAARKTSAVLDPPKPRFRTSSVPTAPAWLQRGCSVRVWGLTSWGRGPSSGEARAEGVNVDYAQGAQAIARGLAQDEADRLHALAQPAARAQDGGGLAHLRGVERVPRRAHALHGSPAVIASSRIPLIILCARCRVSVAARPRLQSGCAGRAGGQVSR
jgi:hypothetical protein